MLNDLQKKIGYIFVDIELLVEALMHPSIAFKKKVKSYERLEFLGNSILGAALADIIFTTFPTAPEGKLSVILSKLSSTDGIVSTVQHLNIGEYITMDIGEEKSGGRQKHRNIENCVEAIVAAIYLDGGYQKAKEFIERFWLKRVINTTNIRDPKSRLQEICQQRYKTIPLYKITNQEGPVHSPIFTIMCAVQINNQKLTVEALHKTRKEAEQESAVQMLSLIEKHYSIL
jgi:ribonuclease-3